MQIDASLHLSFGNKKSQLHIAIDDDTSRIVGGYFDWQETLNGYYNVLKQILTQYGIPVLFKTDIRTIFMYENKKKELSEDTYTQFAYACKTLVTFSKRIVDKDNAIKLHNKYYATFDKYNQKHFLRPKTKVSIIRMMDGQQFILHNDSFFALEKIKYIPPKDHPWRISNRIFFKNSEYKQDYY